jgi:hypothetical protein
MNTIKIELSATQQKGLEYAAVSAQDWAENVVFERARKATDEIVDITVKHCLDNEIQVPATRDAIVAYAFENSLVNTAAERHAEAEARTAALLSEE